MVKLETNMAANCIPEEIFDMDYTQFKDFLEKRRHLIAQKIVNIMSYWNNSAGEEKRRC